MGYDENYNGEDDNIDLANIFSFFGDDEDDEYDEEEKDDKDGGGLLGRLSKED